MTNKEIVSEIVNDLRAHQIDDRVSERYVLSKLRYINATFLKRENDQLRLFWDNNIWTSIDCLKMTPMDQVECTDVRIPLSVSLSKSTEPLPEIYSYKNGPIIREITPVSGGKAYIPTTPIDYLKIIRREYRDPRLKYFWFQDGHLVVPDTQLEAVNVTACFVDTLAAKRLSSCTEVSICADPMDEIFPSPGHLIGTVKQEVLKDLYQFYKRMVKDEVGDMDNNNKTEQGGSQRNAR